MKYSQERTSNLKLGVESSVSIRRKYKMVEVALENGVKRKVQVYDTGLTTWNAWIDGRATRINGKIYDGVFIPDNDAHREWILTRFVVKRFAMPTDTQKNYNAEKNRRNTHRINVAKEKWGQLLGTKVLCDDGRYRHIEYSALSKPSGTVKVNYRNVYGTNVNGKFVW
jgi:hypothetical protein